MTKEDKIKAYSMRLEGASLQECADALGVSREYIRQITPPLDTYANRRSSYATCIYPNIADWLYQNRYSYNRFANLIAAKQITVYRSLTGKTGISKNLIDRILDATGMTYEQAFSKEKNMN